MQFKHLSLDQADLKFEGVQNREFTGYASVFNGVDSYGDTIIKGAYLDTLSNRDRPVQLRWNHYGPIIGKWVELSEDEHGLKVTGELTPGHSVAEDAYALLKHGAVTGLSIGYRPREVNELSDDRRELKRIDLIEISVVESPADLAAQVGTVKSAIEEAKSIRELEHLLRDLTGLSRSEAQTLVSRIKALDRGDRVSETDRQAAAIAAVFQQFAIPKSKLINPNC